MAHYRITRAAQSDIVSILAWSRQQFGDDARTRYEALIATAIRDASDPRASPRRSQRPELGDKVFTWHLALSRARSPGGAVHRPRHFLVCRYTDVLVVGRVLHDAMDLRRNLDPRRDWD